MSVAPIAFIAPSTVLAAYSRWAASRVLAPAEFINREDKAPQIEETDRYVPSVADEWNHIGYQLGADGVLADVETVFATAPSRHYLIGGLAYSEGQHAGYSRFARNLGFEAGLEGHGDALPQSIPSRFTRSYELGHSEGIAERRQRGECMEEYYRDLAADAQEAEHQRELEDFARQVGGWDRAPARFPE